MQCTVQYVVSSLFNRDTVVNSLLVKAKNDVTIGLECLRFVVVIRETML